MVPDFLLAMIMKMGCSAVRLPALRLPSLECFRIPPSDDYENGAPPYDYPHYGYPPWNGSGFPPGGDYEFGAPPYDYPHYGYPPWNSMRLNSIEPLGYSVATFLDEKRLLAGLAFM